MAKQKSHGLLIALLLGIAGFIAGILAAPKSGKETRDEITKDAKKVASKTKAVASDVKSKAADVRAKAVEVKSRSQQAVTGAKTAYNKKPAAKKPSKK